MYFTSLSTHIPFKQPHSTQFLKHFQDMPSVPGWWPDHWTAPNIPSRVERFRASLIRLLLLLIWFRAAPQGSSYHCSSLHGAMPTFSISSSSRWPKKGQGGSDSLKVSGTAGSPAHSLLNSLTFIALTKHPHTQTTVSSSSSSDPCQLIFGYCRNSSPDPWGSTAVGLPYSHKALRSFFYLCWCPDKHHYPLSVPGYDWLGRAYNSW